MRSILNKKVLNTARKIFGRNISSIEAHGAHYNRKHKIAVFVPLKNADELTFAMASAGAGIIGNYSVCSFRVTGIGTFLGGKGSNPKAGKRGKFEMVEEVRIEMLCDSSILDDVIDEMYKVHPYEEPAYEIYDVSIRSKKEVSKNIAVVILKKKTAVKEIFKKINKNIDVKNLSDVPRKTKIKYAVLNISKDTAEITKSSANKILYIQKYSSTVNIEII